MTSVKIENIVDTGNLDVEVNVPVLADDLEALQRSP